MLSDTDQQAIAALIDFWFAKETKSRWYDATPAFDNLCRERFGDLAERAANGDLEAWESTAEGALAVCLLLDQVPRNIFRGTAKAFATDDLAVAVASRAIDRGFDRDLDPERRNFFYLPFMHCERLAEQERSVAIAKALGDEKMLHYAEDHAAIIRRFGRFPHRNTILGRTNTPEEDAFLADGAKTYGQSAKNAD